MYRGTDVPAGCTGRLMEKTSGQPQRINQPGTDSLAVDEVFSRRHATYDERNSVDLEFGASAHPVDHRFPESDGGDDRRMAVKSRLPAADGDEGSRRALVLRINQLMPANRVGRSRGAIVTTL